MGRKNLKYSSKIDWHRIDAMKDEEIDYSDIPELGEDFFKEAVIKVPESKSLVTIRLDKEVVDW